MYFKVVSIPLILSAFNLIVNETYFTTFLILLYLVSNHIVEPQGSLKIYNHAV